MLIFLWIMGIVAAGAMIACVYKKIDLVKLLILALTIHTSLYVIFSGFLIWMNLFNLWLPLLISLIVEILVSVAMLFLEDFYLPRITIKLSPYIGLFVIMLACGIGSSMQSAGYYGTGQDQGLYQIRAMYFMGGTYDNVLDFKEYYEIENEYEKKHYREELADMVGYYRLQEQGDPQATELEGVLHGISTFPALLALWGKVFGLVHMPGVLTFLYLLCIANFFLIGQNLKLKLPTNLIATAVLGVCPIMVWSAQNTLTEIGIALFLTGFFGILTENTKKGLALFTTIPFIAACFFHVTLAILMPLIVGLYIYNFYQTKDRKYLGALGISALGYGIGFTMMMSTARYYTTLNLSMLFGLTKYFINEDNILLVAWIAVAVVLLLALVLSFPRVTKSTLRKWKKFRKTTKGKRAAGICMSILGGLTVLVLIVQAVIDYRSDMWLMKTGIACYFITTGYIMIPLAFAGFVILFREFAGKRNHVNIYLGFAYTLLLYAGFVCNSIYYYYYFTRYYVPVLFLAVLAAALVLDRIPWKVTVPIGVAAVVVTVWQSSLLYEKRDMTYGDYQILENITSCIGEEDCILIYEQGYHIQRLFALQLKGLTGVDIYYADTVRIRSQIENYNALYDNVFVLTYDLGGAFDEENEDWRTIYRGMLQTSIYDKYVEDKHLPYAFEAVTMESPVALMILQDEMEEVY